LIKVRKAYPINIVKLLTDNGSRFMDHFTGKKKDLITGDRILAGKHAFDVLCKSLAIKHRLILPRHSQTNRMIARFYGRSSEIVGQTRFGSAAGLESTLCNYIKVYDNTITQRTLDHQMPIQALKRWHEKT
jgi:transposase InsO family protein